MAGLKKVYAVSTEFPGHSGGFNWYHSLQDGQEAFHQELSDFVPGVQDVNVRLVEVVLPVWVNHDYITEYIEDDMDMVESGPCKEEVNYRVGGQGK